MRGPSTKLTALLLRLPRPLVAANIATTTITIASSSTAATTSCSWVLAVLSLCARHRLAVCRLCSNSHTCDLVLP